MSTSTATGAAAVIAANAAMARWYVEQSVKDVPANIFARKPQGMNMNHPAWALGHLSIYTDTVLQLIGRPELASPIEGAEALFGIGSDCRDDAGADIYPDKETLISRFVSRMNTAAAAVAEANAEALARPNTLFLQEQLATAAALVNFLMCLHPMVHAGQISSWRRAMGLGPCM